MYSLLCVVCNTSLKRSQKYYCSRGCQNTATKSWPAHEEKRLRQFYSKGTSIAIIAEELKRSEGAVRNKAYKLGITNEGAWSEEEKDQIKAGYAANLPVDVIAAQIDRSFAAVACKASELDITKRPGQHVVTDVLREKSSSRLRKWWRTVDEETKLRIVSHPCSEETRKKISVSILTSEKYKKAMRSPKRSQKASDNMVEMHRSGKLKGGYSRGKRGIRKDLGIYVRSSWEANIARYLNYLMEKGTVVHWEYEPHRFEFEKIKRGTRSYLPDFCVVLKSGNLEWWEVKGWWTAKAKTAVKRFRKYYPDEKLVIIDKEIYREIEQEFSPQIPEWE